MLKTFSTRFLKQPLIRYRNGLHFFRGYLKVSKNNEDQKKFCYVRVNFEKEIVVRCDEVLFRRHLKNAESKNEGLGDKD